MKNIHQSYKERITKFQQLKKNASKKLWILSLLRLFLFIAVVMLFYQFWGNVQGLVGVFLIGAILFVFLIRSFTQAQYARNQWQLLVEINQTELDTNLSNFTKFKEGNVHQDDQHPYSQDVDLFGKKSFFQYLNRTSLTDGEQCLAQMLKANDIENVQEKQAFIKELSASLDFRQNYTAHARMLQSDTSPQEILRWLSSYKRYVPSSMAWIPYVFGAISIVVVALFFWEIVAIKQLLLWVVIGLGITGFFFKKTNLLALHAGKALGVFQQYAQLLKMLETSTFSSSIAKEYQSKIKYDSTDFSWYLQQFSKQIDALEQRNNMLLGVVLNGFLLWDLMKSYPIEQWMQTHHEKVANVFEVLAEMDAWISMGNFAYNHPHYIFPTIDPQASVQLEVVAAVHPLLDEKIAISNDFKLLSENFIILTGANMAGKSTFLRTLALQIIMANTGLPVRAKSCTYKPIKLITSMRTTDSLAEESSYFYAELSRLKQVVAAIQKEPHLVILDEILKGTNSHDKAIGAQRFVKRLLHEKAVGIIATHDLSLCTLAKDYPEISNFYFDAEVVNDELYFDYTLKKGICQNMNASFLLEKMGLV